MRFFVELRNACDEGLDPLPGIPEEDVPCETYEQASRIVLAYCRQHRLKPWNWIGGILREERDGKPGEIAGIVSWLGNVFDHRGGEELFRASPLATT